MTHWPMSISWFGRWKPRSYFRRLCTKVYQIKYSGAGDIAVYNAVCHSKISCFVIYIYIFYFQHSCTKVTRTTLCWEEGKATTALTADLKKKKIWFAIKLRSCPTFDPFLCFGPPNATYQKNPRHYEKENNTRRKMHKELDITWLGLLKKKHKNDYTKADDKLWTNQVLFPIKLLSIRF